MNNAFYRKNNKQCDGFFANLVKETNWDYNPKSIISRSVEVHKVKWNNKSIVVASAGFIEKFKSAKTRIIELCQNSNEEYPPNQTAQDLALHTLEVLKVNKVLPSLINSTDDNSLIFEFFINDKFYLIEFYNSGEIVYLRRIEGQPKFVIETTIEEIKKIIRDITKTYTE